MSSVFPHFIFFFLYLTNLSFSSSEGLLYRSRSFFLFLFWIGCHIYHKPIRDLFCSFIPVYSFIFLLLLYSYNKLCSEKLVPKKSLVFLAPVASRFQFKSFFLAPVWFTGRHVRALVTRHFLLNPYLEKQWISVGVASILSMYCCTHWAMV